MKGSCQSERGNLTRRALHETRNHRLIYKLLHPRTNPSDDFVLGSTTCNYYVTGLLINPQINFFLFVGFIGEGFLSVCGPREAGEGWGGNAC